MVPVFMPKPRRAHASLEPLRVYTSLRVTSKWSSVAEKQRAREQQSNAGESVFTKKKNLNHRTEMKEKTTHNPTIPGNPDYVFSPVNSGVPGLTSWFPF